MNNILFTSTGFVGNTFSNSTKKKHKKKSIFHRLFKDDKIDIALGFKEKPIKKRKLRGR